MSPRRRRPHSSSVPGEVTDQTPTHRAVARRRQLAGALRWLRLLGGGPAGAVRGAERRAERTESGVMSWQDITRVKKQFVKYFLRGEGRAHRCGKSMGLFVGPGENRSEKDGSVWTWGTLLT